jgi:hypothetical protein
MGSKGMDVCAFGRYIAAAAQFFGVVLDAGGKRFWTYSQCISPFPFYKKILAD